MSTPPRRGSSRSGSGRPRKIAGGVPDAPPPVVEDGAPPTDEVPPAEVPAAEVPADEAQADEAPKPRRSRTTWILVAVIAVLALVGVAEVVYLVRDPDPTVSSQRPVVTGEVTQRAAVEAAARATEQILSTSYQDYSGQVDKATERMTDTFAKQYRETAEAVEDDFIAQQMKLQVQAVAQSVVQASPEQVQALLFLNQYVEKRQDGQPATSFAQYRALVTMVRTDHGWLVSNIETK